MSTSGSSSVLKEQSQRQYPNSQEQNAIVFFNSIDTDNIALKGTKPKTKIRT